MRQHAHDVALFHDQQLLAVDLDLGPRSLAEQHLVLGLQLQWDNLTVFAARAGTHSDDFALLGLLGGRVGDDDAAGGFRVAFDAPERDAIVQGTEFHDYSNANRPACAAAFGQFFFEEVD